MAVFSGSWIVNDGRYRVTIWLDPSRYRAMVWGQNPNSGRYSVKVKRFHDKDRARLVERVNAWLKEQAAKN